MADLAFFLGLEERFEGSIRSQGLLDLILGEDGVHLVQVEVIRLEPLERAFQFQACALFVPHLGLAGQEDAAAIDALQADPHLDLRVAVFSIGRSHVEVVDA